jgi:hypothetical protein
MVLKGSIEKLAHLRLFQRQGKVHSKFIEGSKGDNVEHHIVGTDDGKAVAATLFAPRRFSVPMTCSTRPRLSMLCLSPGGS